MKTSLARSASATSASRLLAGGLHLGVGGLTFEQLPREDAGLDGLGQLDLLGGVEQRCTRYLVEIHADQVAVGDLAAYDANTACRVGLAGGGLTTGDGTGCHACSLAMVGLRVLVVASVARTPSRVPCFRWKQRLESGQNSQPVPRFF